MDISSEVSFIIIGITFLLLVAIGICSLHLFPVKMRIRLGVASRKLPNKVNTLHLTRKFLFKVIPAFMANPNPENSYQVSDKMGSNGLSLSNTKQEAVGITSLKYPVIPITHEVQCQFHHSVIKVYTPIHQP